MAVPEWHAPPGTPAFNPYPYFRMRADDATLEEEACALSVWPLDAHNTALLDAVHPHTWTDPAPADVYDLVAIGAGLTALKTPSCFHGEH